MGRPRARQRPSRRLRFCAGLLFALPATTASAQLLPETGTTVQVGALRQQLTEMLSSGTSTPATPGWTITPGIGLEERWTDHLQQLGYQGKSSFTTALTPSLLVNGQTARIDATFSYAPTLEHYSAGGQDRINQNLNTSSRITLVPERLFLDLRGYASTQPITGGYGPVGSVAVSRQNDTQTFSFSAHPYLRQRFGDFASAELGVQVSRSSQSALASQAASGSQQNPFGLQTGAQNLLSQQEYLSVASGPELGRTSVGLMVSATQSSGNGVLANARRNAATLSFGYAITRNVTALASLGYDDIHYGGTPPYNYSGAAWSGGVRWVPNPDSRITVTYGRREGVNSAMLDASYAPTARIRVFARYSEGLASGLEQLLGAVNGSTLDPMGNPVDRNAVPVQLDSGFYGTWNDLARVTSASMTMTLLLERDSITRSRRKHINLKLWINGKKPIKNLKSSDIFL